jgi:hypothetical protein
MRKAGSKRSSTRKGEHLDIPVRVDVSATPDLCAEVLKDRQQLLKGRPVRRLFTEAGFHGEGVCEGDGGGKKGVLWVKMVLFCNLFAVGEGIALAAIPGRRVPACCWTHGHMKTGCLSMVASGCAQCCIAHAGPDSACHEQQCQPNTAHECKDCDCALGASG